MEGQGQVREKSPGPGPDRTSDSLSLPYESLIKYTKMSTKWLTSVFWQETEEINYKLQDTNE